MTAYSIDFCSMFCLTGISLFHREQTTGFKGNHWLQSIIKSISLEDLIGLMRKLFSSTNFPLYCGNTDRIISIELGKWYSNT